MNKYLIILFFIAYCSQVLKGQNYKTPTALRPDIDVELLLELSGASSIRIVHDPISKELYYNTFSGDIFRIYKDKSGQFKDEKLFTFEDHGIEELQGISFLDSALFISGNIKVNNDKGTLGILMRGDLMKNGDRKWVNVFKTVEIGGNATIFNHGFNGTAISPDKKYIFVNSGARTDHGEIQDNNGLYPNQRDTWLTSCVFRIPIDTENLLLKNDEEFLKNNGYIFSRGIRNAYDIAFSPKGHLFAIVNSGDYDHPEDMFWLREGHHYGFPWIMGGIDNPQQYPDFVKDFKIDPFLHPASQAYTSNYFRTDPDFPKKPTDMVITKSVTNLGPDANYYRDRETGKIFDADEKGVAVNTFTPHLCPLGLIFDNNYLLSDNLNGDGFMFNFSPGKWPLIRRFMAEGAKSENMIHLELEYNSEIDNYYVNATSIVENFNQPTDAVMIDNFVYVIEYGGRRTPGRVWKLTLPKK